MNCSKITVNMGKQLEEISFHREFKNQKALSKGHNSPFRRKKKKAAAFIEVERRPTSSEDRVHRKILSENPAPFVSAQSWIILNKITDETLFGKSEYEPRQVASLTKIMTAYVVLELLGRYHLDLHSCQIKILPSCCSLEGTSANLIPYDILSVWELLHGMMLPSGNDAA